MNEFITLALYIVLVAIVIFSANRASNYVDELDRKTNIGGALLGGILLAGITSLPELITTVASSAVVGKPGLAFGNIFGSNLFNLVIIALADIYFYKKHYLNRIDSKENFKSSIVVAALYVVILIPLTLDVLVFSDIDIFLITTGQLSLISVAVLVIYTINIRRLVTESHDAAPSEPSTPFKKTESVRMDVIMLLVWAVALVFSSLLLTFVTGEISDILGLNDSFAGALFLGVATSLPELTAVYTLIKRSNYDAAVSNIVGSNIFNLVILSFVDVIIFQNIYNTLLSNHTIQMNVSALLILGLINTIIFMYSLTRKKNHTGFKYLFPSILILVNYLAYLLVSAGTFNFLF